MNTWRSGVITPHILNLSTSQRWLISFMLWLLYLWRKGSWCTLVRRLPESWSGHLAKMKKIPDPARS
jgi:hypothetical protein